MGLHINAEDTALWSVTTQTRRAQAPYINELHKQGSQRTKQLWQALEGRLFQRFENTVLFQRDDHLCSPPP